jgi:acetyl esterase/lipase
VTPADHEKFQTSSEVWLCTGKGVFDLLAPDAEWPFVRDHLSGIQFYIDMIDCATPEHLGQLVRLVQQQHYQVSVECGGTLDFAPMDETNGEVSARIELAKLAKLYAAGGRVDFLNLDGPIRRLMHPEGRRDGRCFDSVEKAADELVDYLNLVRKAHPEIRFFLLTNFPNWGYRGEVSYHARGPQRQDYGDYDNVVRTVLQKLQTAGIPLAGVTVDNPYDYLVGEHSSVNLKDPRTVDWLGRVRAYEDFAHAQELQFNLIVNSERGGHTSDEAFYADTLKMVETYRKAGGRPTRWFVQSWYPHPMRIVPESAPHSLTSLTKAILGVVSSDTSVRTTPEVPAVRILERVSYSPETPQAQMLNAYLVQRDNPAAAIVQIVSGGWNSAPPQRANVEPFKAYLDTGISVIVAAHRPIGKDIHWPAPGDDIARAIQFVRAHAGEWGIDPNRIAVKGRSSGGHLALMAGFGPDRARPGSADPVERQSSRPNCVVAGAAPTDLVLQASELLKDSDRQAGFRRLMTTLVGGASGEMAQDELLAKLKLLSPIEYVTRDSPAVFLTTQGPADAFWPGDARLQWDVHTPITSLILEKKLKELQVPCELAISPESGRSDTTLLRRELAFLAKHLHIVAFAPALRGPEARSTDNRSRPSNQPPRSSDQIVLQPQPGTMTVTAKVPSLNNQVFSLGIPETIGCREAMLLNFPEASIQWAGPDPQGAVSCSWGPGGRIQYSVRMIPAHDYVDVEMTIHNYTEFLWHDVFAFNCLNPTGAPDFKDWTLERTYMSSQSKPLCLAQTQRIRGQMPTVGFYLPDRVEAGKESVFVRGFGATSGDRTDGSWIVTLSQPEGAYMAAAVVDAAFLFDNLDRCCIHAAPGFGDIGPGQTGMTVSRFYLAKGSLEDFLKRCAADRPGLASRQKTASLTTPREQRIAAARESANPRRATERQSESEISAAETRRYSLGAKFEPPAGRVVHGMGQWEQYNTKLLPLLPAELRPASKLIFIDIGDTPRGWRPEGIRSMMHRCNQEGLIPHLDIALRGNQPSHAALAALADPLFGIDNEVASTFRFDGRIQDLARIVREFGKPVIVRIGGEFNGRWNGYHPYAYPKAFRKIVKMFRAAQADNAAFVWCYEPAAPGDFDERNETGEYKWFPGPDVIDWFSLDWFNREDFTGPLTGGRRGGELTAHGRTQKFLDMAAAYHKPVMIAESGPARYDLSDPAQAEAAWREWFEPYFAIIAEHSAIKWFHLISFDWTRSSYSVQNGWKNNDFTASDTLMQRLIAELRRPRYLHTGDRALLKNYEGFTATHDVVRPTQDPLPTPRTQAVSARPAATEPARDPSDKRTELAKFDEPATHLPATGPGGTEWDAHYRSFIQSNQNAVAKGLPTHAEAALQIKADAAKDPANLQKHKEWALFIKHHSQPYRPPEATEALRTLYQDLVEMEFTGSAAPEALPFAGDPRPSPPQEYHVSSRGGQVAGLHELAKP